MTTETLLPLRYNSRMRSAAVVAIAAVLSYAAIVLSSGDAWTWPYQYGDDLLLDLPSWNYREQKLPAEARWIVWLWHDALGVQSAAADFRWSLGAWCMSMALMAHRLSHGAGLATVVCAFALSANPAVLQLLRWPHTALPMMITLLLGSALLYACNATVRRTVVALAVSTCAAMLAFQLFALLLIAAALFVVTLRAVRAPQWDAEVLLRQAMLVVVWGVAGTVAGLLLSYALNDAAFGFFGLRLEAWRQASVTSESRAVLAMSNLREIVHAVSRASGQLVIPCVLIASATWCVLAMRARGSVRMVLPVLGVLLGVMVAPISVALVSGAPVEASRGGLTIWFATIVSLLLLAAQLPARRRRAVAGAMALIAAVTLLITGEELASGSRIRQSHESHLATIERDLLTVAGSGTPARTLIALGAQHPFDSLGSNDEWWVQLLLRARLEPVRVGSVVYCASLACEALRGQSLPAGVTSMPAYPADGYIRRVQDVLLLSFGSERAQPGQADSVARPR